LAYSLQTTRVMITRTGAIGICSLLAIAAIALSACDDGPCSGAYNCPAITNSISPPADISAWITSATGDTCTPTVNASDGSIGIASKTMRPCLVRVTLDNGAVEESMVTFEQLHCCGFTVVGTPFTSPDAATD
jgi:hypothetical protein